MGFDGLPDDGEPEAGATVKMVLMGETQMRMISPANPDQLWRRCSKPVS